MSAVRHQLHQNKLMSPVWTSFQPSAGVEYASAGLSFLVFLFVCFLFVCLLFKLPFQILMY